MYKRILSVVLVGLLVNFVCAAPAAAGSKAKEIEAAAKVKAAVATLGTGPDARIEVKLRDKTKLRGYVSEANDDGFIIVDVKTGRPSQVAYPQVKHVKGRNNLTGEQVGYIALFALIAVTAIGYIYEDNH
jgi:hypothetical protein